MGDHSGADSGSAQSSAKARTPSNDAASDLGDSFFKRSDGRRADAKRVAERSEPRSPFDRGMHARTSPEPKGTKGSKANLLRRAALSVLKAGAKSLAISALVLGPGFALLLADQPILGMVWLFVGSFGLMAWTYRKPWRVGWVSALIPPLAAGACYAIQLLLFGADAPPMPLVAAAIGVGVVFAISARRPILCLMMRRGR